MNTEPFSFSLDSEGDLIVCISAGNMLPVCVIKLLFKYSITNIPNCIFIYD